MEDQRAQIEEMAQKWSVVVTEKMLSQISRYLRLLVVWNRSVNLTGADGLADLVCDHLPDSFALTRLTPTGAKVVDVGSGAGLPAVPFAVLRPDCQVTLIEPRARRVAFLNTARREIDCKSVTVVRGRLDDVADSSFDVAASRATFSPAEWLRKSQRLVGVGGRCIVFGTSPVDADEVEAHLIEELKYWTSNGSPRWLGAYCFT
jgi:16S rRNA (guanine527-N7)-methyltransferase